MLPATPSARGPWDEGKLIGQKAPLKLKNNWAIRVQLQLMRRTRELALFDFGISSKARLRSRQDYQCMMFVMHPVLRHAPSLCSRRFGGRFSSRLLSICRDAITN